MTAQYRNTDVLTVTMSNTIPSGQPITVYHRRQSASYNGDLLVEFSNG